jgi:hypothetical protein
VDEAILAEVYGDVPLEEDGEEKGHQDGTRLDPPVLPRPVLPRPALDGPVSSRCSIPSVHFSVLL